ncbi:MAG: hypothetical protein Kow0062_17710 [Acidobacteriota bacterium]
MRRFAILLVLVVALAALAGCGQKAAEQAQQAAEQAAEQAQEMAGEAAGALAEAVEVAAEGTEFDPPVPVEAIPAGAWYCEMDGKCHYARMTEGDGKCAVCGMHLKQKTAPMGEGEGEAAHEHGEEAAES